MQHKIFSIYDQKAHAYLPPWVQHRTEMAERAFADCCNSPEHQFGKHPEDYTLIQLGLFDDSTGQIQVHEVQKTHGTGINYLVFSSMSTGEPVLVSDNQDPSNEAKIGNVAPIQPGAKR